MVDHAHPPSDAVIGTVRSRLAAQAAAIRVWLLSLATGIGGGDRLPDVRPRAADPGRPADGSRGRSSRWPSS